MEIIFNVLKYEKIPAFDQGELTGARFTQLPEITDKQDILEFAYIIGTHLYVYRCVYTHRYNDI